MCISSEKFTPDQRISKLVLSWGADSEDSSKLHLVCMDFYGIDGVKFKDIACGMPAVNK